MQVRIWSSYFMSILEISHHSGEKKLIVFNSFWCYIKWEKSLLPLNILEVKQYIKKGQLKFQASRKPVNGEGWELWFLKYSHGKSLSQMFFQAIFVYGKSVIRKERMIGSTGRYTCFH